MRHPFGGIILAGSTAEPKIKAANPEIQPDQSAKSPVVLKVLQQRRSVLKGLWGGMMGLVAWKLLPAGQGRGDEKTGEKGAKHGRYLVMPKDFRMFNEKKRQELGVFGNHINIASDTPEKRNRGGFLAWLTDDEAKKLSDNAEIASVITLSESDISGPDERKQSAKKLAVQLAPNSWAKRPGSDTFASADSLVDSWNKEFSSLKGVKFAVSGKDAKEPQTVTVEVPEGETPKELVAGLKKHAQVVGLLWLNPTTVTIGEEGGVTTQALGEEGGPTTKALGEEGGPTTERLGEEATTLAIGEEGGPTTKALGEEGGPVPTTRALGEEGVTTRGLGEEGGPRGGRRDGDLTTQALGEEG